MATLKPVKQKNRVKSGHRPFSPLTLLQHVEWFIPALTFFPTCSDFWLDFPPVVRMACEIKLLESEATTGFFVLLGEQGNKAVLGWVMKEGLIPSRYECQKCKKDMLLVKRKGTIDDFVWRCRVQSKENPHLVCRSVRKGMWFSHSRLSFCVILRLTRNRSAIKNDCREFRENLREPSQALGNKQAKWMSAVEAVRVVRSGDFQEAFTTPHVLVPALAEHGKKGGFKNVTSSYSYRKCS
ncbi:uncharacterized protein TNCV_1654131 [Trichonephila clavipes]|nr:uncharacterized protein TNCV_1654131 [Trichonephila clavipes]